jgi:hypothetical protein
MSRKVNRPSRMLSASLEASIAQAEMCLFRAITSASEEAAMVLETQVRQSEQLRDPHVPQERPEEPDDPDSFPIPDDSHWDVFIPDDDEVDPLPEPGDFWIEPDDLD